MGSSAVSDATRSSCLLSFRGPGFECWVTRLQDAKVIEKMLVLISYCSGVPARCRAPSNFESHKTCPDVSTNAEGDKVNE